ncbi:hypothetical protein PINS_up004079 [Pythium insidiosum]|nr:hypothetical protein PINS_up004079 [Pythium insidiosum]
MFAVRRAALASRYAALPRAPPTAACLQPRAMSLLLRSAQVSSLANDSQNFVLSTRRPAPTPSAMRSSHGGLLRPVNALPVTQLQLRMFSRRPRSPWDDVHSQWQIGGRRAGWLDAVKTGALVAIGAGAVVAAASVGFGFIIFGAAGYGIYSLYSRFIAPYRSHGYSSGSSFSSIQDDIDRIFRQNKGPRYQASRAPGVEDRDVDALLSGLPLVVRGFAKAAMSLVGSAMKSSMARAGELRRVTNERLQSHPRVVAQFGSGVTVSTPQNWMESTVNGVGRVEAVFPVVANGFGRAQVVAKASVGSDGSLQLQSLKYRNFQTGEEFDLMAAQWIDEHWHTQEDGRRRRVCRP